MKAGGPNVQMTDDMFRQFCNLGDMQCAPISVNWLGISSRIVEEMMTDKFNVGVTDLEILEIVTREQERITKEEQWRVMKGQQREDMVIKIEIHKTSKIMQMLNLSTAYEAAYATLFESNYLKGNNGFATIFTFRYLHDGKLTGHVAICALSQSGKPVIIDAQTYELYVGKDNIINNYFIRIPSIESVTLFRGGLKLHSKNPSEIINPQTVTPGKTRKTIQPILPERAPSLLPHGPVPDSSAQVSWIEPNPFDQLLGHQPTNPIEAAASTASEPHVDFDDDFDFDENSILDNDFDFTPNNDVGQPQIQQPQIQQPTNYDPFAALIGTPSNFKGGYKIIKIKYEAYKND